MSVADLTDEIQRLEFTEENIRRALARTSSHHLKESLALELSQVQHEIKALLRARHLAIQVRKTADREWVPLTPYARPAR